MRFAKIKLSQVGGLRMLLSSIFFSSLHCIHVYRIIGHNNEAKENMFQNEDRQKKNKTKRNDFVDLAKMK